MTLVYRLVKGSALTATEFDGNIHDLDDRVVALEDTAPSDVFEDPAFEVVGDQFYVNITGRSDPEGPYDLPAASSWRARGLWQPSTSYTRFDTVYYGPTLYLVPFSHVSDLTFDPGANNGLGDDYYQEIFSFTVVNPTTIETTDAELTTILAHANSYIRCGSETGTEVTVLSDASADHAIDTEIEYRLGVAGVTLSFIPEFVETTDGPAVPIINYPDEDFMLQTSKKGAVIQLKKVAPDEWDAVGWFDAIGA